MHFERDESGDLVPQPGDEEEEKVSAGSPLPSKSVEEGMEELMNMKKRSLDQWCFAEHLEPAVFLQVTQNSIIFIFLNCNPCNFFIGHIKRNIPSNRQNIGLTIPGNWSFEIRTKSAGFHECGLLGDHQV